MIVPARKAVAFLEKHDRRLRDPLVRVEAEDLARLLREARVLLYGANSEEQVALWLFIAVAEVRRDNFKEAAEVLERVRAVHPTDALVANDLGATLTRLDRHEEALVCFVEAQKLSKEDEPGPLAIAALNEVLSRVALDDLDGAIAAFRRAERIPVPEFPVVLVLKALAAAQLGREDDAVEYLARSYCARAGQPRGDAPAIEVIDRLGVLSDDGSATPASFVEPAAGVLDAAVRAVREREEGDAPPDVVPRARVVLGPEAWARLQQLVAE